MPELPEVETIRRDLEKYILYKPITTVEVRKPKMVKQPTANFIDLLEGNQFLEIERFGKLLSFSLIGDWYLLVHLKMTGQLLYRHKDGLVAGGHSFASDTMELPGPYTHVVCSFQDNSVLYFNCMRQFAYMKIVDKEEKNAITASYGVEPLTPAFTLKAFEHMIQGKRVRVKGFLLNQAYVAGIGNIYADEVCFLAHISPNREISSLTAEEKHDLFNAIKQVLRKAVEERGTTFNNYRDANGNKGNFVKFLQVYGRGGKPCFTCNNELKKIKVAGRGTVYCTHCQR